LTCRQRYEKRCTFERAMREFCRRQAVIRVGTLGSRAIPAPRPTLAPECNTGVQQASAAASKRAQQRYLQDIA
jgi:hypothetical protein